MALGFGKGDGTGHYLWRKGQSPQDVKIAMLPEKVCKRWLKLIEPPATPPIKKFRITNPDLIEDIRIARDYLERFFQLF